MLCWGHRWPRARACVGGWVGGGGGGGGGGRTHPPRVRGRPPADAHLCRQSREAEVASAAAAEVGTTSGGGAATGGFEGGAPQGGWAGGSACFRSGHAPRLL